MYSIWKKFPFQNTVEINLKVEFFEDINIFCFRAYL